MRVNPPNNGPVPPARPRSAPPAIQPARAVPTQRREVSPPPLPAQRPGPPLPGSASLVAGWRRKVAILLVVGLVSTAFGAFFLPESAPPRCPARPTTPVEGNPSDLASGSGPTDDETSPPAAPVEQVRSVSWSRDHQGPSVPPRRQPGPAANLAILIDRYLDETLAREKIPPSPLADDAEFLRRVYLDLAGHIPSAEKAKTFLDSTDPYKRSKLIDELLASSEYGRHFAEIWADILIKRDPDNNKGLRPEAFTGWLAEQFNTDKPWNQIVTALVTAEGNQETSPQVLFVLANQDNNQPAPEKLVGAVGNLFMGVQVQCSQCHVHPTVEKWNQKDFWGLAAFFARTRIEREGAGKNKRGGVATVKEVDATPTVAAKDKGKDKGARPMPVGPVINIPDPNDTKKITGTARAKFFEGDYPSLASRGPYRAALTSWLTSPGNRYFAPAAVNRFWAHFFARGFVNPLEEIHDKNPPSHPALLQALAGEFTRSGYDLKLLIRAICNSNAYQRTSRPLPSNQHDERLFSRMPVKVLGARELLASLAIATTHQEKAKAEPARGKNAVAGNPLVRFFDTRELEDEATEFTYGIPQLLKLMNSNLTNSSTEVAARIVKSAGKQEKAIEEIYLTALSRRPHPGEAKRMADYIAQQSDPAKGYAGVFWALLNSAEFATNR